VPPLRPPFDAIAVYRFAMLEARKTSDAPEYGDSAVPEDDLEQRARIPGIRCPKCRWQPRRDARWSCTCGFEWNTFETAGRCPMCHTQWEWTQCLRCDEWSLHKAWYSED